MPEFDPQRFEQARQKAKKPPEFDPTRFESARQRPVQERRYPIGSTIGGIAASLTPYPTISGAAGAALGDIAQTGVEAVLGRPRPQGREILKSAGTEAAYQLGGGLAGKYAMKGLARLAAPVAKKLMPEAPAAISYLEARRMKPGLLPAEATTSALVDTAQNMAEHSILGQNGILLYKQNRQAMLEKIGDEVVQSVGTRSSPEQAGQAFLQSVTGNLNVEKAKAKVLYNTVEQMAQTVQVSTANLKTFAQPLSEQAQRLAGVEPRHAGDELMRSVMAMPQSLSFTDAKALRSRLLSFIDQMSIENKSAQAIGKARQMIKIIDRDLEQALARTNADALTMWRDANRIYAKGQAQFNNSLIRRLAKSAMDDFGGNPEGVVRAVIKLGPSRIARVQQAVDSSTWAKFQNVAAQEVWKKGPDALGVVRGENLLNGVYGRTGLGETSLKAIFSPSQLASMDQFAKALKMTQDKIGVNTGGMLVQMKQAGALVEIGGLVTGTYGGRPGVGAMILLGPAAMSYVMTHPVLSKWLIQGMQLPKGSQQAGQIVGRLLAGIPPRYLNQPQGSAKMTVQPQTRPSPTFATQR